MPNQIESLKPCPFCGEKGMALIPIKLEADWPFAGWQVVCPCGACMAIYKDASEETMQETIKAWNTRKGK